MNYVWAEAMKISKVVKKRILRNLILGKDYRVEIIKIINDVFLCQAVDFFKKVVDAKLHDENISMDWYRRSFLSHDLQKDDIATNAGLNIKTICNMYQTTRKEVVVDVAKEHYEALLQTIEGLIKENEIDMKLKISLNSVTVELSINETLLVINTLAVKRAALRGSLWSSVGKGLEKPLMLCLCNLYGVHSANYSAISPDRSAKGGSEREVDFYLKNTDSGLAHKCEVKLMGKGNPESADAVFARGSRVFIADKLSEQNKRQLTKWSVLWVELRKQDVYRKFRRILEELNITHAVPPSTLTEKQIDRAANVALA